MHQTCLSKLQRIALTLVFSALSLCSFAQPNSDTFPDWTHTDITGQEHHMQDYLDAGKIVIIDYFATWCINCINSVPALEEIWEAHGPDGDDTIVIFSFEGDPGTTNEAAFVETYGVSNPVFADAASLATTNTWNTVGQPNFFVVCPNGSFQTRYGGLNGNPQPLLDLIEDCGPAYTTPPFPIEDITYTVGDGELDAYLVMDFMAEGMPSSFVWNYKFSEGTSAAAMLVQLANADEQLAVVLASGMVESASYYNFSGEAGMPNNWQTWTWLDDVWQQNTGTAIQLEDGMFFGCSYTVADPVLAPTTPQAATPFVEEFPILAEDVVYTIGQGSMDAFLVVDFLDETGNSSFAWNFKHNGAATAADMLNAIAEADGNLSIATGSGFLNDIVYFEYEGIAGTPNYWGTWTWANNAWVSNTGIGEALGDGTYFGCSYTDFNPAIVPATPTAVAVYVAPPLPFAPEEVTYTIGEGDVDAYLIVDFLEDGAQSSYIWNYQHDGTATAATMLEAIALEDENLAVVFDGLFLNDISYLTLEGLAGMPNYWNTWTWTAGAWEANSGVQEVLAADVFFGCSYTGLPAAAPGTPVAAEAPFMEVFPILPEEVVYTIGEGENDAYLIVDFLANDQPSSFAWNYKFDGQATATDMLSAITQTDGYLTIAYDAFLNDITYNELVGLGGAPNFWGTWTWANNAWVSNAGIGEALTDGMYFGCSYTDFDPAIAPGMPEAAPIFVPSPGPVAPETILYTTGEGENSSYLLVDFADEDLAIPSMAWEVKYENESISGAQLMNAIQAADVNFTARHDVLLRGIAHATVQRENDANYTWSTYTWNELGEWETNEGIGAEVAPGRWFGCSYNLIDAAQAPQNPVSAPLNFVAGPYSPAAEQISSIALAGSDMLFAEWATEVTALDLGPQNIAIADSPLAAVGNTDSPLGEPSGFDVISLGDGGSIVLTFDNPISNGPGFDFAVFENSFSDTFLELAFVEVSSDGENFFRFPATSLTQSLLQTDGFGDTQPTYVNNLAGSFRAQFGTPFDLEDLEGTEGLDTQQIIMVRIVDAIGSIDEAYGSVDVLGKIINDPYPTDFESSGFDLDAVGAINIFVGVEEQLAPAISLFPNPSTDFINVSNVPVGSTLELYTAAGKIARAQAVSTAAPRIDVRDLSAGVYFLQVKYANNKANLFQVVVQ